MYISDLHIHSRFSRATSRDLDAPHLDLWARRKGIQLVGTGDFTHPAWREELREMLIPAEEGFYRLRDGLAQPCRVEGADFAPRFVISGEISTIYKKNGKTRKVHHVILLPGLEQAEALSHRLEAIGNLHSDGRPILGLDSRDLLEILLECCPDAIYIPAHIWTPHFSLFGAFSGFETLEECYGDLSGYVHALETGLSSDPPMNRRCSTLDGYTLVSNSDAHSPGKLGREANILDCELSYPALRRAIETGEGFHGTVEFYPEEGKYHLDGHRACGCCLEPSETARLDGRCPICGRKLTIGVLHRVEALADRPGNYRHASGKPFESLMPLSEILADCMGVSPASKRVQSAYFELLERLGSEFHILREIVPEDAEKVAGFAVGEALRRLRAGRVIRRPGYDGEYGVITLFQPSELEMLGGQTSLLSLAGKPGSGRDARLGLQAAQAKNGEAAKHAIHVEPEPESVRKSSPEALNAGQLAAVTATESAVAVIAGPGTGKTKTLVARIAHLIEDCGVSPAEITAVTFTNQAAAEMRARLEERLGGKKAIRGLTVGTFHAICLQLLETKPILGEAQARELVARLLDERGERLSPAECLRMLSAAKNGGEPSGLPRGLREAYGSALDAMGARDLDDLLLDALLLDVNRKRMFSYLLVDEFQDINAIQRRLVRHWSESGKSLFVIGDPDQSIYGFRGASAKCFDELQALLPTMRVITLTQNYRSAPSVLECALSVIARNGGRKRTLLPNRPESPAVRAVVAPDGFSEGVFIAKEIGRMAGGVDMLDAQALGNDRAVTRPFSDIAVLCRTRRQLEQIETCLRHDSIPCVISGRDAFLDDPTVQGLLGFFRSLLTPSDAPSLRCALTMLWRCPPALSQRAEVALGCMKAADMRVLWDTLGGFEPLCPWLTAVESLLPGLAKDKPRKLLEALAKSLALDGRAVERLLNTAVFHDTMPAYLNALLLGEEADIRRISGAGYASGAVRLMTLHGAKGLEFPMVFLAGVTAGTLPLERPREAADVEEERRLFFVGITRACEELIISCGGEPSSFLDELPAAVARQSARERRRMPKAEELSLF